MTIQYYQGDVAFIKIGDKKKYGKDKGDLKAKSENGRYILARGEKTGHMHTVDAESATLYSGLFNGRNVLVVNEATEVVHNEHAPLLLEPGEYEVRMQRQYVPEKKPVLRADFD